MTELMNEQLTLAPHLDTEHSEITVVTVAPMGLLISERCHSETLEQNTGLWWERVSTFLQVLEGP